MHFIETGQACIQHKFILIYTRKRAIKVASKKFVPASELNLVAVIYKCTVESRYNKSARSSGRYNRNALYRGPLVYISYLRGEEYS